MTEPESHRETFRIGLVDTGVNPWHSHVRGDVRGCRIYVDETGRIREDENFTDPVGHGTAVAGLLRETLPEAEIYVVRVFSQGLETYPSLVARGLLRAAAEGCAVVNLSLAMPSENGTELIQEACRATLETGCRLVAAGHPRRPGLLPASLPGVFGVIADDNLKAGQVRLDGAGPYPCRANGAPRGLTSLPPGGNLWGNSFACARVAAFLSRQRLDSLAG